MKLNRLFISIIVAYLLWLFSFNLNIFSFWIRMLISSSILFLLALLGGINLSRFNFSKLFLGIISGFLFYILLYIGYNLAKPLVYEGAKEVYNLRLNFSLPLISLLLFFISTSEEVFWRGYIQRNLSYNLGSVKALALTSLIYSTIHIWTLNFPLIFIALIMGFLWGFLFYVTKSLLTTIASHIVWNQLVFIFLPLVD
ncbi:hypothetical protein HRbin06_00783 [archaeon HR06]|nr:hypothetical protein HRbin06_00783 [archaeon HR06]